MQHRKKTFLDFVRRTDLLASELQIRIGDLPAKLDVSRASLFGYRNGKIPISEKGWRKLERAEREAGISASLETQLKSAPGEQKGELIASASLPELLALLPSEARDRLIPRIFEAQLETAKNQMRRFFQDAEALADLAESKGPRAELLQFAKLVRTSVQPCLALWETIIEELRVACGLTSELNQTKTKHQTAHARRSPKWVKKN